MKNFVIPPVNHLDLHKLGTGGFFALGQLCKQYPHYKQYVKDLVAQGVYVILDSGIGDHSPITQEELFELTVELKPSEVIPLDTLFNADQTIINVNRFVDLINQEGLEIKILACPQGNSVREWLMCYDYFLHNDYVNTIGMSKLSIPHVLGYPNDDSCIREARQLMAGLLKESNRLHKELHFLGMGDPLEFVHYKEMEKHYNSNRPLFKSVFRSTDSCNVIFSAMNEYKWIEQDFRRVKTPKDYFERTVSREAEELANSNSKYFQSILKY